VRKDRVPAVLLDVDNPSGTTSLWLRKYKPKTFAANGSFYDVMYGNKRVPLEFSVTLKDFEIGRYPGTMRPRSFESQITFVDSASGGKVNRVVSMNHPTEFGGYMFYQSSYQEQGEKMVSVLSVSRDPGQPIVFVGYVGTLAGMLLVLGRRILAQRGRKGRLAQAGNAEGDAA
jgi:cytochrome c biogenesis protein ResB